MQQLISKISFRSAKLNVKVEKDTITLTYGNIFIAEFPEGSDLMEFIYINEAYSYESIEKLAQKCLDHMYKESLKNIHKN